MAYTIDRYNNTQLTVVEDGTIDQTTDLKLVGKNYAGYGEIQNENFVFLLENFSGANPPPKALSGQIWFDSGTRKLKFYDGTKFRTTGGAEVSSSTPSGLTEGDFWWDTGNEQLYAYNGTDFILVGPQDAGEGVTQFQSKTIRDNQGNTKQIIAGIIDDETVLVLSSTEFTIDSTDSENAITGFDRIRKGMTLKDTLNSSGGVTTSDFRFTGTATNAEKLGGVAAADYVRTGSATFSTLATFADVGIAIGDNNDLAINIIEDNKAVISNEVGEQIFVKAKNNQGQSKMALRIESNAVYPGRVGSNDATTETVTLGTETHAFNNVYASNFTGLSEKATNLVVGGSNRTGNESATSGTVAVRTSSTETINGQSIPAGSLKATYLIGTATQAQYADLAEKYTTAEEHPTGTVLSVSTDEAYEVGLANPSDVLAGVVSAEPAYLMNAEADGQAIALKGRVPVRVVGSVAKGDPIYVLQDGLASAQGDGELVGVALESNADTEEKLVECILKV